jgi:hypothetical protein
MTKIAGDEEQTGWSRTYLLVVAGFSAAAFLVRWAGLAIPVFGTEIIIDPREIFVTLGAALTGPVGGAVIGFFADLSTLSFPNGLGTNSMIAHIVGGVLFGLLYRPIYNRVQMPGLLVGWSLLVAAYYYIFLIPAFVASVLLAGGPERMSAVFGTNLSFLQAYTTLGQAALPEATATLIVTTIILIALPDMYRRPLR